METTDISRDDIRTLRREALEHADWAQDAICQRALGAGDEEIAELVNLTDDEQARVLGMTKDDARAECARVVSAGRG